MVWVIAAVVTLALAAFHEWYDRWRTETIERFLDETVHNQEDHELEHHCDYHFKQRRRRMRWIFREKLKQRRILLSEKRQRALIDPKVWND